MTQLIPVEEEGSKTNHSIAQLDTETNHSDNETDGETEEHEETTNGTKQGKETTELAIEENRHKTNQENELQCTPGPPATNTKNQQICETIWNKHTT